MNPVVTGVVLVMAVPLTVALAVIGYWLHQRAERRRPRLFAPPPDCLNDDEHLPQLAESLPQCDTDLHSPVSDHALFSAALFAMPPQDVNLQAEVPELGANNVIDLLFAEPVDAYASAAGDPDDMRIDGLERWDAMDFDGGGYMLEFSLSQARQRGNKLAEARALDALAQFNFRRGDYQPALSYLTALMRLAPDMGWEHRVGELARDHMEYTRYRDAAAEVLRLDAEAQRLRYEDEERALGLAHGAVDHARQHLLADHWLVAHALITLGCMYFDRGMSQQARDIWDDAEVLLSEWQERAPELITAVEENLQMCRQSMGF